MTMLQKQKLAGLISDQLLISAGCTEPIAIAYACAIAKKTLGEEAAYVDVFLSGNMIKNAMGAGIPGSKYVGAAFVAAMGTMFGDSSKGFELLVGINEERQELAYVFSKTNVKIHLAEVKSPLYIEVVVTGREHSDNEGSKDVRCSNTARVVVADGHKNIKLIEYNGKAVSEVSTSEITNSSSKEPEEQVKFSMKDIYEYANELQDFGIFIQAITINTALSAEGMAKTWGLDVGKMIPFGEDTICSRILSTTTAAVDARMAGAELPAMACTGSGNQGITITMPIYQLAKELKKTDEEMYRAVAVGVLTAIYIKRNLNVLSHLCGAVIASASAAAGMTYLLGGEFYRAESAVQNVLAAITGMFCDGAKSTCALKVAAGISIAIYSANMAMTATGCIKGNVGFVRTALEETIANVASIEKKTSGITDPAILETMLNG